PRPERATSTAGPPRPEGFIGPRSRVRLVISPGERGKRRRPRNWEGVAKRLRPKNRATRASVSYQQNESPTLTVSFLQLQASLHCLGVVKACLRLHERLEWPSGQDSVPGAVV